MFMARTKKIPQRTEVREQDAWDLTPLFRSDDAWERAYRKLERMIPGFDTFRGKLGKGPKVLRDCYEFEVTFEKLAERLGNYAFLKASEDVANQHYQGMVQRYIYMATRASERASYIAPEIQAIPKTKIQAYLKSPQLKDFRFQLVKLLRYRPHILSEGEERVLAMQGEVAGTADRIFSQLTDADFKFGFVEDEKGVKVELTQGSFRSLLESPKRAVRKEAFDKFYKVHEDHANTLAAALNSSVLQDVYYARVRNHPSAREAALFADNVPVSVYDNLIEAVHENLDVVHRYLEIRRRALKVKSLHAYDNYAPIVREKERVTPYDRAVDLVVESLAPLGDQYCSVLENGMKHQRWVDKYENQGKRSGAFSAGGFAGPPYILMNYKDNVFDHVFTLTHEAGHSMHTYYSARNQPYQNYSYTIFVAEVASTFNEQLLNHSLLQQASDSKTRAYLINREIDEIRGTVVRQTMFAEFEKICHAIAEAGEALTLDRFRAEYRTLIEQYFGPDFAIDESLTLEGLRIPHFYRAFYVYKYATGLSAAVALSRMVLAGGAKERDRYLNFLKSGGSKFPLDLLKDAGVNMTKPEPVATTMAHLKDLVVELDSLV
jgi:oligoendopeptidase F